VLDIDLLLWSGGAWAEAGLVLPHPEMRRRAFVLEPLAEIAADWRDPLSGASVRQLLYRLRRPVQAG
jgi:2-amino-4-hydroxy-6-hydroxymethyldihydropteridine diphosphokinase